MPNLNPHLPGVYAHGVAGDEGVVSVNGNRIAGWDETRRENAGGNPDMHGPSWFSATEVLCKIYPPERLVAVDWQTGHQHVLYEGAVSDFCGGGGRWAALCLDGVVRVGSRDGVEYEYRNQIAPIAFGPDGSFAFKEWHRDGLILDGVEIVPPHVRVEDVQVFGAVDVLYRIGRVVYGYGAHPWNCSLPFDFGWVRGVQIGARWLLSAGHRPARGRQGTRGLVCRQPGPCRRCSRQGLVAVGADGDIRL
jgi:hypothetical protein